MLEELINRLDKILPVGGGFGVSAIHLYETGISFCNIQILLNQCLVTFLLAVIGGIGGWLGGHFIKKLYASLLTKKWYQKMFNVKPKK